jgi:Flp pilus assembly protein TadG
MGDDAMTASLPTKIKVPLGRLRRFLLRQDGGSSLMVGFLIVPLIAAIGLATDASRGFLVKSRLSSSLDAAALAGGKVYFADDRNSDIADYFRANYPSDFLNGQLSPLQIVEQKAPGEPERLQLTANVVLPTLFMHLVGVDQMSISAQTEITRVVTGLQVALILDNTGSMLGQKLADLRSAAKDFVDTLFGPDTSAPNPNLSISVVPYSQAVNVGNLGPAFIDMSGTTYDPDDPNAWQGCVDSRATLPILDSDPTVLDAGA